MSVLDDARALRREHPWNRQASGRLDCAYCYREIDQGHKPQCPSLRWPGVLAALEAAIAVVDGAQWAEDDNGDYRVPSHLLKALATSLTADTP